MKRLIILLMLPAVMLSCSNHDRVFDDFDTQTLYFPNQYPVRTLSLGNDILDNSIDRQHKFTISVLVGGFYENNDRDWRVNFEIDETLVPDDYLKNPKGAFLKALPREYYTLSPDAQVTIPKGSFEGKITVSLTDAFFEDPLAITGCYVVPLRITGSPDTENILHGTPNDLAPVPADPHVTSQWDVLPKDYTLFGVKYVNPYHGDWLRRGKTYVRDASGQVVNTITYHAEHTEYNTVATLTTTALNQASTSVTIDNTTLKLSISADDDQNLSVNSTSTAAYTYLYGSGKYKEYGDSWGGTPENPTPRDAIYLDYFFQKGDLTYEAIDTLVFRDRNISFEATRPTPVN